MRAAPRQPALHHALGLALALLLNLKVAGMNFYRTVFYIPAVISGVAVSLMWMWPTTPSLIIFLVLSITQRLNRWFRSSSLSPG